MMLRFGLFAASLCVAACATPPASDTTEAACDLKVNFASIGTGIDSATLQNVDALLSGDTGVSTVDRQRWGKEGEITLCVDTKTGVDATRLFYAVIRVFPEHPQRPLSVETAGGQKFEVNLGPSVI